MGGSLITSRTILSHIVETPSEFINTSGISVKTQKNSLIILDYRSDGLYLFLWNFKSGVDPERKIYPTFDGNRKYVWYMDENVKISNTGYSNFINHKEKINIIEKYDKKIKSIIPGLKKATSFYETIGRYIPYVKGNSTFVNSIITYINKGKLSSLLKPWDVLIKTDTKTTQVKIKFERGEKYYSKGWFLINGLLNKSNSATKELMLFVGQRNAVLKGLKEIQNAINTDTIAIPDSTWFDLSFREHAGVYYDKEFVYIIKTRELNFNNGYTHTGREQTWKLPIESLDNFIMYLERVKIKN